MATPRPCFDRLFQLRYMGPHVPFKHRPKDEPSECPANDPPRNSEPAIVAKPGSTPDRFQVESILQENQDSGRFGQLEIDPGWIVERNVLNRSQRSGLSKWEVNRRAELRQQAIFFIPSIEYPNCTHRVGRRGPKASYDLERQPGICSNEGNFWFNIDWDHTHFRSFLIF
jgi:hypothetical protein